MPTKEYAKAYFSLINEEGVTNLSEFVLGVDEDFYKIMDVPSISKKEKKEIIENVVKEETLQNFLKVLIDNNRMSLLVEIDKEVVRLFETSEKIMSFDVYTKIELSSSEIKSLNEKLSTKFNSKVRINNLIDESLIGGIKIRYEDKIIDNTIKNKLEEFKNILVK